MTPDTPGAAPPGAAQPPAVTPPTVTPPTVTPPAAPPATVRSPADLVAAVPYLLGFHPADSVVVVAARGRRLAFAARHDLPAPGTPGAAARAQAAQLAGAVARQRPGAAAVLGYGPAARVTPAVLRTAEALRRHGVDVADELRVTAGRFWSYRCADPACCPPGGTPCPPPHSPVAVAATVAGAVALPDRATVVAQAAPVTGAARTGMAAATLRAEARLHGLAGSARTAAGRAAVAAAEDAYRSGRRLTDDDVAALGVLLAAEPVRDHAWERADGAAWRVGLWTDVVRRVDPVYVPAPACLLAFTAWRAGAGALAWAAVDRARQRDPAYPMATLMADVLACALAPAVLDAPGSPAADAVRW